MTSPPPVASSPGHADARHVVGGGRLRRRTRRRDGAGGREPDRALEGRPQRRAGLRARLHRLHRHRLEHRHRPGLRGPDRGAAHVPARHVGRGGTRDRHERDRRDHRHVGGVLRHVAHRSGQGREHAAGDDGVARPARLRRPRRGASDPDAPHPRRHVGYRVDAVVRAGVPDRHRRRARTREGVRRERRPRPAQDATRERHRQPLHGRHRLEGAADRPARHHPGPPVRPRGRPGRPARPDAVHPFAADDVRGRHVDVRHLRGAEGRSGLVRRDALRLPARREPDLPLAPRRPLMQTVSQAFLSSLRVPHVVATRATVEQPTRAPVAVPVVGGEITMDAAAAQRRTGQLVVPWTFSAADEADLGLDLAALPFGSYCLVERGIRYADGTSEYATLGRLRIDAVSWRTSEGLAQLELADRMVQVADEPLLTPYTPAGKQAADAIIELVTAVFGTSITYTVTTPATAVLGADVTYTDDRAKAVQDLAESIGARVYFTAAGTLVVTPPPASGATPVWDVDASATGVLIDADESLDRTETFNGVLARGQANGSTPPVQALVTDTDAASPTVWGGPYGKVARIIESNAITTVGQATDTATAALNAGLGLGRNLTLNVVPNPALEPGDPVRVAFGDGRVETHTVMGIRMPLDPAASMEVTCRALFRPAAIPTSAARRAGSLAALAWLEHARRE